MKPKSLNKAFAIVMSLILIVTLLPTTAFATGMPEYSGGTGTKEDPWLISSVEDLKKLADTINSGEAVDFDADAAAGTTGGAGNYYGYYFKQTCDLDLSAIADWEPIGYSGDYYFAGNYDGGNYTILNMTSTGKNDISGYATAGLFGWVAFGSVSNVHVKHADLKATGQGNYSYAGGIAGVVYGSSVANCSVSDSVIESARDKNNNCAGGITGYSTGGTFERCAAEGNAIKTMAYGGGFVGEIDDTYDVGDSSFTNCYVANSSVTAFTEDVQGISFAGEFLGELTSYQLNLTNCFAYNNTAAIGEGSAPPYLKKTGVFVADYWSGSQINISNSYYYTKEETPVNTGSAQEKTVGEFADGTVAALLGETFIDGTEYPVIKSSPADYSKVDAAVEAANALNKDEYKNYHIVEDAVSAVIRGKTAEEQATVDGYAEAIENAISALEYKDADYTKVDEAIAKAEALNKDEYKDFSGVEAAINAVVRDKNITEQAAVDAMAKAIEDAIAALEIKFSPVIIVGMNGVWQKDSKDGLSFTSNAEFADFSKVQVDNKDVDASSYTVKEGSTIVTLKPEYLNTLSVGKHTLSIVSSTGIASTEFTITAAQAGSGDDQTGGDTTPQIPDKKEGTTTLPQTGDNSNMVLWIALLVASGAGLSGATIYSRKKRYNQ